MRDFLYGDMPVTDFPPAGTPPDDAEPMGILAAARQAAATGYRREAVEHYKKVLGMAGVESRITAQAWLALRELGVKPGPGETTVLGAVVEAGVNGGLDVVAAYPDGRARYYNFSDAGVVWESPGANPKIAAAIEALMAAAVRVAGFAGVWDGGARPGPPPQDQVRITAICPDGLHFGQGPMDVFFRDPVAGPFMAAAQALMLELMEMGRSQGS